MSQSQTLNVARYDSFDGPTLDPNLWQPLVTPQADGTDWVYLEPDARTNVADGAVEIAIDRFSRSHDTAQSPDNAKHLLMSTQAFPVPAGRTVTLEIEMAGRKLNGSPDDHRDGFITFNVFDLESLLVFDVINTGTRTLSVYERLAVPGLVDGEDAFTYVVDSALCGVRTSPEEYQHCAITLDAAAGSVRFTVDGKLIYLVPSLPVIPKQLNVGMGLMTLLPIQDGRSVSVRGQGMVGRWRNLGYRVD
jgi:Family of unknown function (DUF6081)